MIVVYKGYGTYQESRHQGLFEAYATEVPVVYVDPMATSRSEQLAGPTQGIDNVGSLESPGIYHTRLRWMVPGGRFHAISRVHHWLSIRSVLLAIRRGGRGDPVVFVVQNPGTVPTLRGLPAELTVYEVRDDYVALLEHSPAERRQTQRDHNRLLRSADIVLAISEQLADDIRPLRPDVQLTSVGVGPEFFVSPGSVDVPESLRGLPRPRVGFVGNLNDRVDWQLLEMLARARPNYCLVIVGSVRHASALTYEAVDSLGRMPNVHFLPRVAQSVIPNVISGLDVCLIPYRVTEAVKRINPLKLYQYLAGGKPVVSMAIPSVRKFSNIVAWCESNESFVHGVDRAVRESPVSDTVDSRRLAVEPFRWKTIAEHQLSVFARALAGRRQGDTTRRNGWE
jgi:glycosyltransferase involved in cell wall biosynthesis